MARIPPLWRSQSACAVVTYHVMSGTVIPLRSDIASVLSLNHNMNEKRFISFN